MLINANVLLSYYNVGKLEINNRKKFGKFTNNVEIITFLKDPRNNEETQRKWDLTWNEYDENATCEVLQLLEAPKENPSPFFQILQAACTLWLSSLSFILKLAV